MTHHRPARGRTIRRTNILARPRRLGAAGAVAAGAALAVTAAGGIALASDATSAATGTITACYRADGRDAPLELASASGSCARDEKSLTWNQQGPQGPQGPPGASAGTAATSGTLVPLTAATTSTVLTGPAVPASGTYYVTAAATFGIAQGNSVVCDLESSVNATPTMAFTEGPEAADTHQTLPLDGALTLAAGAAPEVRCTDTGPGDITFFQQGTITAVLIANPTDTTSGAPATLGTALSRGPRL